jgi:hypothetical protein
VPSFERAQEILALCDRHGWQVIVGVEEDKPEDVTDVEKLLRGSAAESAPRAQTHPKVGRNERCPCGSGLKFKRCCGSLASQAAF